MDTIWSLLERNKELQELGILTSLSVQFLISQLETYEEQKEGKL